MSLILDLTTEEEAHLYQEARQRGLDMTQYVRERLDLPETKPVSEWVKARRKEIMDAKPVGPTPKAQAAIDMLTQWMIEDVTDDQEELARRDAESAELQKNLRENRVNFGEPDI